MNLTLLSDKTASAPESNSRLLSAEMKAKAKLLHSGYIDTFDYTVYDRLKDRYGEIGSRRGIIFKKLFGLQNYHSSCQMCHYSFELDTYGRGCWHDCVYCYAKDQLTKRAMWNNPQPFPISIVELREAFYTVFETDKRSKWSDILGRRIPLRLGAMSDCFMYMDKQYKVTLEVLKILKYYDYPYVIFTKSDLVAHDEYMKEMNPNLAAIQMSISSVNEKLNRQMEPAAPSATKRLLALQKLSENGFNTAIRVNPLFPIFPDGHFSGETSTVVKDSFPYFSWDLPKIASEHKITTFLAGFVRLNARETSRIKSATGIDLKPFFKTKPQKGGDDLRYTDEEIAYYYRRLSAECKIAKIDFTTCYIGNGAKDYFNYQDLWSNKSDCCNVAGKVKGFKEGATAQSIPWDVRVKHSPADFAAAAKNVGEGSSSKSRYIVPSEEVFSLIASDWILPLSRVKKSSLHTSLEV